MAEKQFAGRPRYAPEGYHWRCRECGRISLHDRFGLEPGADRGWDTPCVLHAVLTKNREEGK